MKGLLGKNWGKGRKLLVLVVAVCGAFFVIRYLKR
jgi:hypothetical protein